ncbi:MAG: hypothetical protein JWP35_832 [Caulobacter sp.]|nr:hypothetical protein [Caulobacter sp.]
MTLWDWTLAAYGRPDVPQACLHLQDDHGLNTSLLLWSVWAGASDAGLMAKAAAMAKRWDDEVLWPLRNARRALKARMPDVDDAAREGLREDVKAAELRAERVLMESLEALSKPHEADPVLALEAACAAWGTQPPLESLERLAAALR